MCEGLKKKERERATGNWGTVLLTDEFTQLWFVITGVVYLGIEL